MQTPSPDARRTVPVCWDIEFTRLSQDVFGLAQECLQDLALLLPNLGLSCEVLMRQTPRGLSTYVPVVGQRGLLCIFDFTLVDGMRAAGQPGAALEVRLLDAEGDVVAAFAPEFSGRRSPFGNVAADIVAAAGTGLRPAALLSAMTTHFCAGTRKPSVATRQASS